MAGRWSDEAREREYWDRERRYDQYGLDDERGRARYEGREDRSFDRGGDRMPEAGRDRVFGERESGVAYNRPQAESAVAYGGRGGRRGWQDDDYGGVSPAMRRGDYDTGYRAHPSGRGGRHYGDDGRPDEAGYGRYGEGRRFGTWDADERWSREMQRPVYGGGRTERTWSGGTGGYDYERGYGDGGRGDEGRGRDFEDRARDAGEFVRRTGQRISNWFEGLGREDSRDYAAGEGYGRHRGMGPKGYKRSDERISDDAHQHLTDDPWLDASDIGVSVSGGEVTLSGTVETREAKHRAERIVEDLSGVTHVQNNLRVKAGSWFTSAGRGYGDSVQQAQMAEGDRSTTTAATATGTTSRGEKPS